MLIEIREPRFKDTPADTRRVRFPWSVELFLTIKGASNSGWLSDLSEEPTFEGNRPRNVTFVVSKVPEGSLGLRSGYYAVSQAPDVADVLAKEGAADWLVTRQGLRKER